MLVGRIGEFAVAASSSGKRSDSGNSFTDSSNRGNECSNAENEDGGDAVECLLILGGLDSIGGSFDIFNWAQLSKKMFVRNFGDFNATKK